MNIINTKFSEYDDASAYDMPSWEKDIIAFIASMEQITGIGTTNINIHDKNLISLVCSHDMTGVYELGNEDVNELIKSSQVDTFDDLARICAIAHGFDTLHDKHPFDHDILDFEWEKAYKRMTYSLIIAWYKLNHYKEFCQAYFEFYVCEPS